eukprot:8864406-Pyramimonas_sp.AAC.1
MHCCLDLPAASSSLRVASRARMRASSASPLPCAWEGDLRLLFDSSPRICLMSSCQGVVVPCAPPSVGEGGWRPPVLPAPALPLL